MKKKLEGELISIAHRILKLKNKSELAQLHLETQKLYQKLSVLLFVEENFSELQPTIGLSEIEEKIENAFDKEEEIATELAVEKSAEVAKESEEIDAENDENINEEVVALDVEVAPAVEEEMVLTEEEEVEDASATEPQTAQIEEDAFKPSFELSFEPKEEKVAPKQITFEDLLGHNYSEPIFEKVGESEPKEEEPAKEEIEEEEIEEKPEVVEELQEIQVPETKIEAPKTSSLNDLHGKTITFGLNDRIGFEKHLFGGSSEDMNRVVSQLSTFDSYEEALEFIDDMVKPDYDNWEGKDDFAQRFMEIVEKKFN